MRHAFFGLSVVLGGLILTGCAPGFPETARVSGKVTLNKQPLTVGEIQFIAEDGHIATGQIEPDGSYRLRTFLPDDGAVPGAHRVIIRPTESFRSSGAVALISIPGRYADPATSGLTARVNPGINRFDFNLDADEYAADAPGLPP